MTTGAIDQSQRKAARLQDCFVYSRTSPQSWLTGPDSLRPAGPT
jgi:hypothetical protein